MPRTFDFITLKRFITKTSEILPLSLVIDDKRYDSEDNHILVRDVLDAFSVIRQDMNTYQYEGHVVGTRKQMKHGYSKLLYGQRNKDETIVSVIKRLFGESILHQDWLSTQNRENNKAYNMHRLTNLLIIFRWFLQSHKTSNSYVWSVKQPLESSLHSNANTVLLLDDEFDIITVFKQGLEKQGFRVFAFTDPLLALEHFQINSKQYGLVISDLRMPRMNGYEFIKKVKEMKPQIKVFFMTDF